MTLEELRQGNAALLMVSPCSNGIYSRSSREQLFGRQLEVYTHLLDIRPHLQVFAQRRTIATPQYLAWAREIRARRVPDYSADLGLVSAVSLTSPGDTPQPRLLPTWVRVSGTGIAQR